MILRDVLAHAYRSERDTRSMVAHFAVVSWVLCCHDAILVQSHLYGVDRCSSEFAFARAPTMDGDSLVQCLRDFTPPHRVLEKHKDRIGIKLAEVAWKYMQIKDKDLVNKARGRPVLISYGTDVAPMLAKATTSLKSSSGQIVMRRAGRSAEFLLVRAFLRTTTREGQPLAVALFRPPNPLDAGKGSLQVFSASCRFFPVLHKLGHRGISVARYCFDRALYAPLAKKQAERYALYLERLGDSDGARSGDLALSELKTWVVCTARSNHDAQHAQKRALRTSFCGAGAIDKLYVAVEAIRNAYDLLCGHMRNFIEQNWEFQDCAVDTPEVYHFWVSMGVLPDVAEKSELGLWWMGPPCR